VAAAGCLGGVRAVLVDAATAAVNGGDDDDDRKVEGWAVPALFEDMNGTEFGRVAALVAATVAASWSEYLFSMTTRA